LPDAEVARYEFRAVRPVFDIHPFFVCGVPQADGKTFHLWAKDHEGSLTMDATAMIRHPESATSGCPRKVSPTGSSYGRTTCQEGGVSWFSKSIR
jgi:hypothetical protein